MTSPWPHSALPDAHLLLERKALLLCAIELRMYALHVCGKVREWFVSLLLGVQLRLQLSI